MLMSKKDAELLQRARRMASRSRAASACLPCKARKAKCSDGRPCTRCAGRGLELCVDGKKNTLSKSSKQSALSGFQDLPSTIDSQDVSFRVSDSKMLVGTITDLASLTAYRQGWTVSTTTSQVDDHILVIQSGGRYIIFLPCSFCRMLWMTWRTCLPSIIANYHAKSGCGRRQRGSDRSIRLQRTGHWAAKHPEAQRGLDMAGHEEPTME